MDKLNFYTVDLGYIDVLKKAEMEARGFSRVPNMDYGKDRKEKFLCGIVLQMHGTDYFVPVTSFKEQKPDNFLILADNGNVISSLRFNYMIPVPAFVLHERRIDTEVDGAYRSLLSQELSYCNRHSDDIRRLAERTYKRVMLGKNPGLVHNSCGFALLETICRIYKDTK